jgi:hypothetical protein
VRPQKAPMGRIGRGQDRAVAVKLLAGCHKPCEHCRTCKGPMGLEDKCPTKVQAQGQQSTTELQSALSNTRLRRAPRAVGFCQILPCRPVRIDDRVQKARPLFLGFCSSLDSVTGCGVPYTKGASAGDDRGCIDTSWPALAHGLFLTSQHRSVKVVLLLTTFLPHSELWHLP